MASFRERLAIDVARGELKDADRRYLLVRDDTLMAVFRELPPAAREQALASLARAVVLHGSDSARAYFDSTGGDGAKLWQVVVDTAPQLGWGVWRVLESGPRSLKLAVANSPFASGYGPSDVPVCHAITGMLTAVGQIVWGGEVVATETQCAATGAPECRFEVSAK